MALVNDTNEIFTCVDTSGTRYEPKPTESAGVIEGGTAGYFTTTRREVVQELEERYPAILVTRHEKAMGGKASRKLWVMPALPWKGEKNDEEKKETDDPR